MPDKSEQTDQQSDDSKAPELKSIDEMKSMSFQDIEKELTTKDYSKVADTEEEDDQANEDSDASDDDSTEEEDAEAKADDTSKDEQTSDDDEDSNESDDSETDDEETSDKQKKKKELTDKERLVALEKSNKELQGEFTRRSQRIKDLEKELASAKAPEKKDEKSATPDNSKLAQLRKKDPEAASALEALINEQVEKRVKDHIKPVEEQVTLRTRKENAEKFSSSIDEFKKSELAPMEAELVSIYNENPAYWQQLIWENGNAFDTLKKEVIYRNFDKAASLRAKKLKDANNSSTKQDRLKGSSVGTKTKVTTPTKDVMSDAQFKNLSLAEMEKRLRKV